MDSQEIRSKLATGTSQGVQQTRTTAEWFDLLYKGWFSTKTSTEELMRGSANEDAFIETLGCKSFVRATFEVGMLGSKSMRYIACSPDYIAVLDVTPFNGWNGGGEGFLCAEDMNLTLSTMEIKTSVAPTTMGHAVKLTSADVIQCDVGDETLYSYVPLELRKLFSRFLWWILSMQQLKSQLLMLE